MVMVVSHVAGVFAVTESGPSVFDMSNDGSKDLMVRFVDAVKRASG